MLFSRNDVADFLRARFEPARRSIAPIAILRPASDYGVQGEPTSFGNSATFVCTSDGLVVDVLPGMFLPEVYIERLGEALRLVEYVERLGPTQRRARMIDFHRRQAAALAVNRVLVFGEVPGSEPVEVPNRFATMSVDEDYMELKEDTRQDMTIRRRASHVLLAEIGLEPPGRSSPRVHREAGCPDICDPFLGKTGYRDR